MRKLALFAILDCLFCGPHARRVQNTRWWKESPLPAHVHRQVYAAAPVLPSSPRRVGALYACGGSEIATGQMDVLGRQFSLDGSERQEKYQHSDAVVKVYTVHSGVSPSMPWTSKPQEDSTGSGFAIQHNGELLILTNAHVVADASYVEVRKAGDATKYMATRRKVSHECDLATLTVDSEAFWRSTTPLSFGSVPQLQGEVSVIGYPEGGEGLSVTVGVVSRIEIQRYAHSGAFLLAIQIDAAINPGNSGGPAFNEEDKVIGVAFQNQQQSQNIGYVIPLPVIEHFLADTDPTSNGTRCNGFCSLGIHWQALENEELRKYCGIPNDEYTGILSRGINPYCAASKFIKEKDIILAVDGEVIANDGTISVGTQQRLPFQYIIQRKFMGETIRVKVLRQNEVKELDVPVQPLPELVPQSSHDEPQPYFLYGGFAFTSLTRPYLDEWGDQWQSHAPFRLVELALTGERQHADEQPVVLSHCFPSQRTAGITTLNDRQVVAVNGHPVINIHQMYTLVQELHATSDFLAFELWCAGGHAVVTIGTDVAEQTLAQTMQVYRVPAKASAELLESHAAGAWAGVSKNSNLNGGT